MIFKEQRKSVLRIQKKGCSKVILFSLYETYIKTVSYLAVLNLKIFVHGPLLSNSQPSPKLGVDFTACGKKQNKKQQEPSTKFSQTGLC